MQNHQFLIVVTLQHEVDIRVKCKQKYLKCDDEEYLYNTQKPKALIERIIKASSNQGDLVADFYAGSFTTAEVCKDLNRNFIGCDISEKAVEIGYARVGQKK